MRGEVHEYRDAEITIDGVRMSSASVTFEREPTDEPRGLLVGNPVFYEFTYEVEVRREVYDQFVRALMPPIRGATDFVLAKRASYRGGRKGRRAMRRLVSSGYAGIIRFEDCPWIPLPPPMLRSLLDGHARWLAEHNREALRRIEGLFILSWPRDVPLPSSENEETAE